MSVTSGFFNSQNGDRKYTAEQFSELFNSLITDGVFSNIGSAFMVSAGSSGMTVNVGVGRSWFDSIWLYNDALLPIALSPSEVLLNRIDAVVIEVDKAEGVRAGSIKIVEGTPLSTPSKPVLTKDANVTQYPLAYIYVAAGATSITQANITNAVGTSECPYVTGILKTQEIDNIVAQWQSEFDIWFENLDVTLSGDVAANLASQVLDLYSRFDDLATYGSVYSDLEDSNGNKIMDNNGLVIQGRTTFANEGEVSGSSDEPGGSVPVEVEDTFKVGDILMTARTDLGNNWLLCNGELVDEPTYPSLYAQIPDPKIFVVSSWSSVIDLPETAPANDTATVLKTFIKREQFIYAAFLKGNGYKYYAYIYKFDNTGQLIDSLENYLVNFEYTRWSGGSFEVVNGRLYIAGVDSNGSSDDDILIYSWNVNDLSETPTTNSIPSSATVNANYNEFFLSSMGNYMYLAASNSTNVGIIYANLLNLNSWSTCMAKNHSSKSTGISFRKIGEDALIYQTVTEHGTSSSYSHPCVIVKSPTEYGICYGRSKTGSYTAAVRSENTIYFYSHYDSARYYSDMSLDNLHEAGINDYANSNVSLISNDCLDLVDEKIYRLDDNGNISYYGPVPAGTDYYSTPLFILPLRPENVSASDIYPIRNENGDIVGAFNYATIDPSGITTTRKGWHFQLLSKNTPLISIDGAYAYIKAKE